MGRSASRLSRTRSGVVSGACLFFGMAFLSAAAHVPPPAFFREKRSVASLGNRARNEVRSRQSSLLIFWHGFPFGGGSNTTTGLFPRGATDRAPGLRRLGTCRGSRRRCAGR